MVGVQALLDGAEVDGVLHHFVVVGDAQLLGIDGLHEIDLDFQGAGAGFADVFVDVFFFALVAARESETEGIHPESPKPSLVEAPGEVIDVDYSSHDEIGHLIKTFNEKTVYLEAEKVKVKVIT